MPRGSQLSTSIHLSLLPSCSCKMSSCLKLLSPRQTVHLTTVSQSKMALPSSLPPSFLSFLKFTFSKCFHWQPDKWLPGLPFLFLGIEDAGVRGGGYGYTRDLCLQLERVFYLGFSTNSGKQRFKCRILLRKVQFLKEKCMLLYWACSKCTNSNQHLLSSEVGTISITPHNN